MPTAFNVTPSISQDDQVATHIFHGVFVQHQRIDAVYDLRGRGNIRHLVFADGERDAHSRACYLNRDSDDYPGRRKCSAQLRRAEQRQFVVTDHRGQQHSDPTHAEFVLGKYLHGYLHGGPAQHQHHLPGFGCRDGGRTSLFAASPDYGGTAHNIKFHRIADHGSARWSSDAVVDHHQCFRGQYRQRGRKRNAGGHGLLLLRTSHADHYLHSHRDVDLS